MFNVFFTLGAVRLQCTTNMYCLLFLSCMKLNGSQKPQKPIFFQSVYPFLLDNPKLQISNSIPCDFYNKFYTIQNGIYSLTWPFRSPVFLHPRHALHSLIFVSNISLALMHLHNSRIQTGVQRFLIAPGKFFRTLVTSGRLSALLIDVMNNQPDNLRYSFDPMLYVNFLLQLARYSTAYRKFNQYFCLAVTLLVSTSL